ncbi:MAG: hydroxymethylglutaryl-CoA reductase [bacterium]|nr:hydroxymethylglutaryl-CoA reductase [bacterium]
MGIRVHKNPQDRLEFVEQSCSVLLPDIGTALVDTQETIHCENLIGAVSIPLGIAGPLQINGEKVSAETYIPLATTEGALVASISRGSKIITEAGGASVITEYVGITRGSVFEVKNITEGKQFISWINDHHDDLAKEAALTSSHLTLLSIEPVMNGTHVYLRISYDTQEAMGMNMVTIATAKIASYLEAETPAKLLAVAGNYDTDKKPSWLNFIKGRGRKVWAEVTLPKELVQSHLHTSPKQIAHVVKHKCWGGSMLSGSMGFNAHFANIVAAFYLATGQDAAHVVEGSLGVTSAEVTEDGSLYFAIYAPSILLGTVGGGTNLKTQSQARSITKTKTSQELAEVLAGALLAGELSLLASLSENTLATSHQLLGR